MGGREGGMVAISVILQLEELDFEVSLGCRARLSQRENGGLGERRHLFRSNRFQKISGLF